MRFAAIRGLPLAAGTLSLFCGSVILVDACQESLTKTQRKICTQTLTLGLTQTLSGPWILWVFSLHPSSEEHTHVSFCSGKQRENMLESGRGDCPRYKTLDITFKLTSSQFPWRRASVRIPVLLKQLHGGSTAGPSLKMEKNLRSQRLKTQFSSQVCH